ncbi:MAG: carboxylesterase family protein, partial [Gammaproteobacteria bacterium]
VLHAPAFHSHMATLHGAADIHGGGPAAALVGESGGDPAANLRAREGVADIGRRWDEKAFMRTVALYTDVHRGIEWPGVLAPETFEYGPDEQQTLELYRPEQEFSEPGPVFVFMHGNGLGNSTRVVPGSDGLIYSHLGKLAATAGSIGVLMNYRNDDGKNDGDRSDGHAMLESGAEDVRLALEWVVDHIADYDGDPGTIVIVANSEGATATAAYLFNEDWQMESGHGVAAAILSSGRFGAFAPEIESLVFDYQGQPAPLALWSTEYDTAQVTAGIADLHEILCRKYDGCPWYEQIAGHNHVSQLMSLGTADTDVMNRFIRFYHTVR